MLGILKKLYHPDYVTYKIKIHLSATGSYLCVQVQTEAKDIDEKDILYDVLGGIHHIYVKRGNRIIFEEMHAKLGKEEIKCRYLENSVYPWKQTITELEKCCCITQHCNR